MKSVCVILAAALWWGWQPRVQAELADAIAAVVHNSVITTYQISMAAQPSVQQLDQDYANQPDALNKKLEDLKADVMEQLLERKLILREFETAGYSLPESVVDDYLRQYIRDNYGDRVTLTRTLQAEGMTYEDFRKKMREQFIVEQMRLSHGASETIISPYKIEMYYQQHTNDYKVAAQVKLRMIVLNKPSDDAGQTHKLAQEILAKIKGGAAFADMAKVYSQGSQQKEGGEWGWWDKSGLRKELADAAFALKPGETSDVIDTPGACYLLLVEDKRPAHVQPLKNVRDSIESALLTQEQNRLQKQWIDRLKKKTFIRYF